MAELRPPELDIRSFMTLEINQMLNDTIVEYYMVHCMNNLDPAQRNKFHLFNTFLHNKLKYVIRSGDENLNEISRSWDKNVKIFDKEFLIVPVCAGLHWFLVIICNPAKVPAAHDDVIILPDGSSPTSNRPCIIICDSLNVRYMSRFTDTYRKFLQSRWKFERPTEARRDFRDRRLFPEFYAKVPKQKNHYDCGIYMLEFYECFIKSPLSSLRMIVTGRDMRDCWKVDALSKRNKIKSIISKSKCSMTIT